jgi:hypothetical protein
LYALAVPAGVLMPARSRPSGTRPTADGLLSDADAVVMERTRANARFLPGDFPYFAVAQAIDEGLVGPVLAGAKSPAAVKDAQPTLDRLLGDFGQPE